MKKNILTKLLSLVMAIVMVLGTCSSALGMVSQEQYDLATEDAVNELYQKILLVETEEELDALLTNLTAENLLAIYDILSEENQTELVKKVESVVIERWGYTIAEVRTFTNGYYVDGELLYGAELADALFAADEEQFNLAVNQLTYEQAGSLEGVITSNQSEQIMHSMCHTGFDVSGTAADLTGVTFSAPRAIQYRAVATNYPQWPNEGAIKLDKDAQAVENADNLWEVTLQIQGKNYRTTSDVVLVLDRSGSMSGTKRTNTIKAAKAFGEKLLVSGSTTRIAIVTFNSSATAYNNGHFYTSSELDAFKSAVDSAMNSVTGGTNQQAGLHTADQLLASSTGILKNIVIMSDGEATYSYSFIVGTAGWTGCSVRGGGKHDWNAGRNEDGEITDIVLSSTITPNYTNMVGNGSNFSIGDGNAYVQVTCDHGNTRLEEYGAVSSSGVVTANATSTNGDATVWEANQIKAKGTTIYSVALQAGTNGESVLKNCATDANTGYYAIASNETDVEGKLTAAFEAIAGSIAIAASQGIVLDPMGEKVELSFQGAAPTVTTDLEAYTSGQYDVYISQGSITYNQDNYTFDWTVGNVNEGTPVVLKYKVGIREGVSVTTGEVIPTNKTTTFTYTDYQQNDASQNFPIPNVTVGGGTIMVHWYLVNENGQPINADGDVVEGKEYAYQIQAAAYHSVDGSIALEYDTPYTITAENFDGYAYYNYTWNTATGTGNTVAVTIPGSASSQHVWFAYCEQQNGALSVKKNVVNETGLTPAENEFDFTVTFSDTTTEYPYEHSDGTTGVIKSGETFSLEKDQTITITEIPDGVTYSVTEAAVVGYETTKTGDTGTITAGETSEAVFTNTYVVFDLIIVKEIVNLDNTPCTDTNVNDDVFAFAVTLPAGTYSVDGEDKVFGETAETINITGQNQVVISGIPTGAAYNVVESATLPTGYVFKTSSNASGNLSADTTATIVNTYKTSTLSIGKTVEAKNIDEAKEFTFTVTLPKGDYSYTVGQETGTLTVEDSSDTLTLKHGETAVIAGVPVGATYTVAETADANYTTTVAGAESGTMTENGASVAYTNIYKTGSLTISKSGIEAVDNHAASGDSKAEWQSTIYRVQGIAGTATAGIDVTVVIYGNSSTTITDLPLGNYTVTELTDWAWRYTADEASEDAVVDVDGVTVPFSNRRTNPYWLNGDNFAENSFGAYAPATTTPEQEVE